LRHETLKVEAATLGFVHAIAVVTMEVMMVLLASTLVTCRLAWKIYANEPLLFEQILNGSIHSGHT